MKTRRKTLKQQSNKNPNSIKFEKNGRKAKQVSAEKLNKTTSGPQQKAIQKILLAETTLSELGNEAPLVDYGNIKQIHSDFKRTAYGLDDWTDDESIQDNLNYNQFNLYGYEDPRSDIDEDLRSDLEEDWLINKNIPHVSPPVLENQTQDLFCGSDPKGNMESKKGRERKVLEETRHKKLKRESSGKKTEKKLEAQKLKELYRKQNNINQSNSLHEFSQDLSLPAKSKRYSNNFYVSDLENVSSSFGRNEDIFSEHSENSIASDKSINEELTKLDGIGSGNRTSGLANLIQDNLLRKKESEKKFLEEAWKTKLQKDNAALNKRVNRMETEVKEVKRLLKRRSVCRLPKFEDDEDFALLPNFPLKKKSRLTDMEGNINSNRDFKRQLVEKFATIGGASIKNNVINIFGEMFTAKLRTKISWNGSSMGAGKIPFHPFKGLRDVLRKAVKRSFDDCTRSHIDKKCQLRFKQADKDYQREKEKKNQL